MLIFLVSVEYWSLRQVRDALRQDAVSTSRAEGLWVSGSCQPDPQESVFGS